MIEAICGYFYGFWGPSGRSEIVHIVKKVGKKEPNMLKMVALVGGWRDIYRARKLGQLERCMDLVILRTFFTVSVISERPEGP